MSSVPNLTYNQVVERLITYIISNCHNITNYAGISSTFKSGYSQTITIPGGNAAATCYCTVNISGNALVASSEAEVRSDMTSYLSTIGLSGSPALLDTVIKQSEFIKFLNDLVAFCSARMYYSTSQYSQSTIYFIYNHGTVSYTTETILTGDDIKEIDWNDANSIINIILNYFKKNARSVPCVYSLTYS